MEVKSELLIDIVKLSQTLIEAIQEKPHSFLVNSLTEWLSHSTLEAAGITSEEEALKHDLPLYIKNCGRTYTNRALEELNRKRAEKSNITT